MIKSSQQKELTEEHFRFITALTKVQIETLIKTNIVQHELFDEHLNEVVTTSDCKSSGDCKNNVKRYILKHNPVRAAEIAASQKSKLQSLQDIVAKKNEYLSSHLKAFPEKALQHVQRKAITLKIASWIKCEVNDRVINLHVDDAKLEEQSLLDGCYCLTTNVSADTMDKELVHARYKDLAMVEEAFRTCKTRADASVFFLTDLLDDICSEIRIKCRPKDHVWHRLFSLHLAHQAPRQTP
jgi:hypothetical protein